MLINACEPMVWHKQDAVEEIICKVIDQSTAVIMTPEQWEIGALIERSDKDKLRMLREITYAQPEVKGGLVGFDEFEKLIKTYRYPMPDNLVLWIPWVFREYPIGTWQMIALYIQWHAASTNKKSVSLGYVVRKVFPKNHVPSKTVLNNIWAAQKVIAEPEYINLVDSTEARKSFMP